MKTSFAILAFIGFTSAASLKNFCGPPKIVCEEAPVCVTEYAGYDACGSASGKQAHLGSAERSGAFATLSSESAGSSTNIAAQNIVIPDRHTVTDQTKVSEACSKGSDSSQNAEISKRTFDINGSISVCEKYNDSSKGENCAKKEAEAASQTRSRSQVLNNLCAKADIPCTYGGCPPAQACY